MPNQHTVRKTGYNARGTGKSVRLSPDERSELEQGAARLGESLSDTLRKGGLKRARTCECECGARDCSFCRYDSRGSQKTNQSPQEQAIAWDDGKPIPSAKEYACAYCPGKFTSEALAIIHIDAEHPEQS